MSIFKCKMCGGSLEVAAGETIIECEYCGTQQTLPKTTDENIQALFNRANLLRQKNEFDKAEAVYEKILEADDTEAEAYWGVILCKFGIEYVEDPKTYKRIPTCHRTSYDSIVADEYYKKALENADITQRSIYEAEAKKIDEIQKGILAISAQEEPYDVFICYKETYESGKRTQDSVIANDIYYQLTQEGFKVFYAAITLEDKLGSAYEPIIFAALNSSKVMLSIGTKPEYFNAVWVKNEWSRFLKMMKNDRTKMLIPCYKGMDAYELPEEFAHLQAQDMGKIGFINDIVRGIKKVIVKDEPKATIVKETLVTSSSSSVDPLLKRAFMFLEDGEWEKADNLLEQILNQTPENAEAYLGKLMADLCIRKREQLKECEILFEKNINYKKAVRFGDEKFKELMLQYATDAKKHFDRETKFKIFELTETHSGSGKYNLESLKDQNATSIVIPDDVVSIRDRAFYDCDKLTSVTISKSVESIGEDVFSGCINLESVHITDMVRWCAISFGTSRSNPLYYAHNLYLNDELVQNLIIPEGVKSIGRCAFQHCNSITSVTIPNSVISIGGWAFDKCRNITSIVIPDSVTGIDHHAFEECTGLTRVTIGNGVKCIGSGAFVRCTSLKSVIIGTSVTNIDDFAFFECNSLASIVIPDSVTRIGDSAFYGCASLENVTAPDQIKQKIFKKGNGGCYVATCVYGSYDCPQVWTLRRYRDDTLGSTWYGRLFIRTYYAISPILVKLFGKTKWFKKMWKGKLDRMVKKLQDNGVESTPYNDKNWM